MEDMNATTPAWEESSPANVTEMVWMEIFTQEDTSSDFTENSTAMVLEDFPAAEDTYFYTFQQPPKTVQHMIINACLGVLCLVGLVLCSLFLNGLRKAKASQITARWCLSHVIVMDMAISAMQLFGVLVYFTRVLLQVEDRLFQCTIQIIQVTFSHWTTIPSMASLLVLALDQLLAVFFPVQMRMKVGGRIKKGLFSLIIWGPSFGFTVAIFVVSWPSSGDFSCSSLLAAYGKYALAYSFSVIVCVGVDCVMYGSLFVKVLVYTVRNRFRQCTLEESLLKLRRLFVISLVIFASSVLLWLPPFMFLFFTNLCVSNDTCRAWRDDIWLILASVYQLNAIFDPLFLAWRFNLKKQMLCKPCANSCSGGRETEN